ncbi:amino acid ABC transporter permease [Tissierella sp. Yu-01]|uniref:amino acid ABC transporter permease n=1 Tax=Tissierella sp. Yu-01 TaxID=3035694 RepID=UPI00240E39DD|nr:amino acid ABC transporter permease [Tissierella sp. Yu-01]WFA09155.1 amino acid ABC transporter permease [Tissierella sp. Yu-01]
MDIITNFIEFMSKYYSYYLNGTLTTLQISFFGVIFGTLVGVLLCLLRMSNNKIIRGISTAYIEIVRGTPLILQIYVVYYGLPMVLPLPDSRIFLGTLAVLLNSAAYVSEIIRAGIQSIDTGQMEAARSLGMGKSMSMRYIIIPQAFKNILPALGNEFIVLVKESAIISVIAIPDLMYNADTLRGITYKPFMPLIVAGIIYFTITFTLSKILGLLERRLAASDQGSES